MNLIEHTDHRSWPIPSQKWIMRQGWHELLFVHWPVPVETVRPWVPAELEIDTFDGHAWVAVCSLLMDGIYVRGLPFISLFATFPEINVRTYVTYRGRPGVYFLSLDASNWLALTLARPWYHLNYYYANISVQKEEKYSVYRSIRKDRKTASAAFYAKYISTSDVYYAEKDTLDHWLMERYCLYSFDSRNNIYCAEVHHRPWPLQKADVEIRENTMTEEFHIRLDRKPVIHYSKGVDSQVWNITKL